MDKVKLSAGYKDSGYVHSFDKFCEHMKVNAEERQMYIDTKAWPYTQDGAIIYTDDSDGFFSYIMYNENGTLLVSDKSWAIPRKKTKRSIKQLCITSLSPTAKDPKKLLSRTAPRMHLSP